MKAQNPRHRGDRRGRETSNPNGFRYDIQGMRGLAVLLVVIYHAWPGALPGGFVGVDVFFTLSGFVIGSLLLGEIGRAGTVSLRDFWTRRARRLLPASLLVVAATLTATWFWAPASDRDDIGGDGLWASLFAANLRFINQGTDYMASERDPSPFQHFWSLAVEEQFYVVIPLVFAAGTLVARRRGWSARVVLGVVMGVVTAASLAYSVYLTSDNLTVAYFSPWTRAWQLSAGVVVACAAPALARWSPRLRDSIGLAGLATLAATLALFDETGFAGVGYPSFLSVAPTLATAALLLSGTGTSGFGARMLSVRPLRRVGDVSYSLYLWHWPVLIVGSWLVTTSAAVNGVLVVLAYALAELSYRFVENPVRRWSWLAARRSVTAAVAISSIALVSACAAEVASFEAKVTLQVSPTAPAPAPSPAPGEPVKEAPVTEFGLEDSEKPAEPFTLELDADKIWDDYAYMNTKGCQKEYTDGADLPDVPTCTFGSGDKMIYIVGDSIAGAISPALREAAKDHDARVRVMAKASCTLATGITAYKDQVGGPYRECDTFRENLLRHLEQTKPDVVFMVNSFGSTSRQVDAAGKKTAKDTWVDAAATGLVTSVERLRAAGIQVVLIENPASPGSKEKGSDCLVNGGSIEDCSFDAKPGDGVYETAYERLNKQVPLLRVNDTVCPGGRCVPVMGNLIVWRDTAHFTKSFAKTLAPVFDRALTEVEKQQDNADK